MSVLQKCFALFLLAISVKAQDQFVKLQPFDPNGANDYDSVVYINDEASVSASESYGLFPSIKQAIEEITPVFRNIESKPSLHLSDKLGPDIAFVYAPTGKLNTDIADSRSIYDAATEAFELLHKSGKRKPVLVIGQMLSAKMFAFQWGSPKYKALNAVLGAFQALYVPMQLRESTTEPTIKSKYDSLYLHEPNAKVNDWVIMIAKAVEEGRWITRDVCGADSEAMKPQNMVQYIKTKFNGAQMSFSEKEINETEYPLMALVNQASKNITQYNGRIVSLNYPNTVDPKMLTLYLIGKGVTFDTGGANLKVDGAMVGMSRDKCGAAAILGFIKTASLLPTRVNIKAKLAIVRNNIGSENYVTDTIIKLRNGKRIRIGNTDAEGRNIMTELIMDSITEIGNKFSNNHIYTIATLTGHVIKCYRYIMGIMDNGPAARFKTAQGLQTAGSLVSDPGEISVIRKEDYDFNLRTLETEDLLQCNNQPSSKTDRGHQFPMAFMVQASGLEEYSNSNPKAETITYTHLDVAGSAGVYGYVPTASPMTMLASKYLFNEYTVMDPPQL